MIAHLAGTLLYKGPEGVVVDCGGVGYRVEVPLSALSRLPDAGERVALHIHTAVREDAIRLFGFLSMDALRLFERLLGVQDVGPKLALAALSHFTPEALQRAVVERDTRALAQVSGIGKKKAERIVMELAEPLSRLELVAGAFRPTAAPAAARTPASDLLDALRYLGYEERRIRRVVQELGPDAEAEGNLDDLIKRALKLLQ